MLCIARMQQSGSKLHKPSEVPPPMRGL